MANKLKNYTKKQKRINKNKTNLKYRRIDSITKKKKKKSGTKKKKSGTKKKKGGAKRELEDLVDDSKFAKKQKLEELEEQQKLNIQKFKELQKSNSSYELQQFLNELQQSELEELKEQRKLKKILDRDTLSGKINWLAAFAGTDDVMNTLFEQLYGKDHPITIEHKKKFPSTQDAHPNTLIFKTSDGDAGHWGYVNKQSELRQSYVCHQKDGKNQFCQTFAILYMLNDHWDYIVGMYKKLKNTTSWENQLIPNAFAHNIRVVVNFWRFVFFETKNPDLTDLLIEEVKKINAEYIALNNKECEKYIKRNQVCPKSLLQTLVHEDTDQINEALIKEKLDDIYKYAVQIAYIT